MNTENLQPKLALALLLLRLGVGIVFVIWTADKFVNPDHTVKVYEHFYMISWLTQNGSYIVGVLQGLLVLAFLAGFMKTWSYGAVFLLHAVSTLMPMANYFSPWQGANILFFAAWPMLAAELAWGHSTMKQVVKSMEAEANAAESQPAA